MLLDVNNLEVVYSDVILVLKGVNLSVDTAQIVALLGANGAGKTTTLKAISGLLRSEDGEILSGAVRLNGDEIQREEPQNIVRRGLVQVVEGRKILPHMTVEQNLLVGGKILGSRAERREMLDKVYGYFPKLPALRNRVSGYLSGGEQQMLVIGRALMAKPRIVLLDEPSLGLAPLIVAEIFRLIERLRREEGIAFLVVEQNAKVALAIADHGYVLENGRIMLEGSGAELRENEDIKEFYLGMSLSGQGKSFRDVKHYKRRKRWLG
ncbi:ABC transporter ATP-binding protein [Rhodoligotrophos defluvii]|uniref:ABC transporter ATP-binding protein n=1 Tax=Rhodoligotrophos defluvii TaxID=2561934 RepID=UPI001960B23B|nr:ABC transporter ATP-binding protein [Rhodoligotrophos defluvii]